MATRAVIPSPHAGARVTGTETAQHRAATMARNPHKKRRPGKSVSGGFEREREEYSHFTDVGDRSRVTGRREDDEADRRGAVARHKRAAQTDPNGRRHFARRGGRSRD